MGTQGAGRKQGSGFLRHGRIWRRLRLVDELLVSHNSTVSGAGARITKLGIFAALMLAAAGASCGLDARAADIIPATTSATAASAPKSCWYNGQGYLGVSSPTFGTLTVFRQNSLTYNGAVDYDPMGSSRAFSPIQGMTGGVGDTEDTRYSTSLKYRVNVGQYRVAALWQFGGYAQNNAANGAYQFQAG